uniref:GAG-pre-integrase domain-containing protein n=1 Tax=Fagus sylvatica TaxID=28930 RepID=A0A2N9EU04_FAGSY
MAKLQAVGSVKKLNNQNYNTWSTCMESYLQGQDLWEIVAGSETTPPDNDQALRKWKEKWAILLEIVDSRGEQLKETRQHPQTKKNMSKYKGKRVVVTADNTRLPIAHIAETLISLRFNAKQLPLEQVYHVPGVYKEIVVISTPMMKGPTNGICICDVKQSSAYVDKTRKNETVDLWHARLGHVSYHKLKVMMNKSLVKGLPQLECREDTVCAGCQYGKAHQLSYQESKFRAKEPLELVHSNMFGRVKQSSIKGMRYMVTFIDDFSSKFDKKAIRCIFVGYDSQRKGWRCCDPTTGRCYTSRNVIFDEASSWWSEDKATLPVLKEIAEKMPESMEEQSGKDQSKTGVHHKTPMEDQPRREEVIEEEESPQPQLRRSMRHHKANHSWVGLDWIAGGGRNSGQRLEAGGGCDVFNRLKLEAAAGGGLAARSKQRGERSREAERSKLKET